MCLPIPPAETIRLCNGVSLQIAQSGDPRGAPVLLLHGVTDSLRSWKPFIDAFPRRFRAIAVTQRGHGDSSKPADDYSSSAFVGDLAALMDALGLQRAHIVAHSMSTWIAQRFARDYPERIETLTLISGFVTLQGNAQIENVGHTVGTLTDPIDPAFVRAFQESTVARPLASEFLDMVVAESLKAPARVWRATFAAMSEAAPDTQAIPCRALLIGCEKDELFSTADRATLAATFPGARQILYRDLGHAPHWDDPVRVASDIAGFLSEPSWLDRRYAQGEGGPFGAVA